MKILTIEVADEVAANLEAIRDMFCLENTGRILDWFLYWMIDNIANYKDEGIAEALKSVSFNSLDEAHDVADRIDDRLEKIGKPPMHSWFTHEISKGRFLLRPLEDEYSEKVFDFAKQNDVEYESMRELIRLKVCELDERAARPHRDWIENPPDLDEILPTLETDIAARRTQKAAA
jgi:hypothetical protein